MEWQKRFVPIPSLTPYERNSVGDKILQRTKSEEILDLKDFVFFTVDTKDSTLSFDLRKVLYGFKNSDGFDQFCDLGDYHLQDAKRSDHCKELAYILSELIILEKTCLFFCPDPEFVAEVAASAYRLVGQTRSVIEIGHTIAQSTSFGEMESSDWLSKALFGTKKEIHNYGLIGYQSNNIAHSQLEILESLGFESIRLGTLKSDILLSEPLIRQAEVLCFNSEAIQSHFLGMAHGNPNGLSGEEACSISKFAGATDNLRLFSLSANSWGLQKLGAHQYAQMLWYFMEGTFLRFDEKPLEDPENYQKFITPMNDNPSGAIHFYKSLRTEKWWFYLGETQNDEPLSRRLIPCSYSDYLMAVDGDIPLRWIQALARLQSDNPID